MVSEFTEKVITAVKSIPKGKVATYGLIAAICGNVRAARQVSYVLHSCSKKEGLPWHRVVNRSGMISLKEEGYEIQKQLLENEGVIFDKEDKIDLEIFLMETT